MFVINYFPLILYFSFVSFSYLYPFSHYIFCCVLIMMLMIMIFFSFVLNQSIFEIKKYTQNIRMNKQKKQLKSLIAKFHLFFVWLFSWIDNNNLPFFQFPILSILWDFFIYLLFNWLPINLGANFRFFSFSRYTMCSIGNYHWKNKVFKWWILREN